MDEKIAKLFLPLVEKLYNLEPAGEPFRKPVDVVKYGCYDYYLYVKHPIDLSTIKDRLNQYKYKHDAWRAVADIQLMFTNAYLFNKRGTPVYEFTNKLNKIWTTELTPVMQKLNYCCGTLYKFGPQLLFCHGTTTEKYCQIPIGAKYKCYQDQYSFCVPCFNKIDSDYINIQNLSCETTRMKLPTQPVKKSDFIDVANDNWQYESFVKCSQCTRRCHQICELYPANKDEIEDCPQHERIEEEQRDTCLIPEEYREQVIIEEIEDCNKNEKTEEEQKVSSQVPEDNLDPANCEEIEDCSSHEKNEIDKEERTNSSQILPEENKSVECNAKNSVDNIAARLSINKLTAESQADDSHTKRTGNSPLNREKFVCNHCYRKKKIGFNLRHRKFSARRLPHTRMSRYIETKVNEYIRENTPSAGEVTIRVLTAYRDTVTVKPELNDYINRCRESDSSFQHSNAKNYPDEFNYLNRAIFAWQEIDGVDVCVFGMHVQEYGEDCPEPNRQVVYLSYLDSVHFFRPKQFRTAVYHEILLSYFKYVKKLGFRRVFIWVCPSRKGDDYIFYRHPTEQKMPTLKRLSDWYVSLLDKGIKAGIVERHENIYQYASSQSGVLSILSMPYLSGDYWPGEFERLLKIMIESQKAYETKLKQNDREDVELISSTHKIIDMGECSRINIYNSPLHKQQLELNNMLSLTNIYQRAPPTLSNGKIFNMKNSQMNPFNLIRRNNGPSNFYFNPEAGDISMNTMNEDYSISYENQSTQDSSRADSEQPLDLSKSSSTTSPDSYFDEDLISEHSFNVGIINNRKRRRKSVSSGYVTKKRGRGTVGTPSQTPNYYNGFKPNSSLCDSFTRYSSQTTQKLSSRNRSSTQSRETNSHENTLTPEEELIKNLERSLKRQKEGFIVARLNECDCSPHFESQRRKEEPTLSCELMKGRDPFLQLARLEKYEFSSLRRAKFSSLAMVKHLSQYFKLEPICNECFSFDSSKRHYVCSQCEDFYLCTSCHDNTHHEHIMSLVPPSISPDIDEFLQQCSLTSGANSISSASSTISSKSFNESNLEISTQSDTPTLEKSYNEQSPIMTPTTTTTASAAAATTTTAAAAAAAAATTTTTTGVHLSKHLSNSMSSLMPLSCKKEKNQDLEPRNCKLADNEENVIISPFETDMTKPYQIVPPPSHSTNAARNANNLSVELDQVLVENFIRHAEVSYDVDFDQMKNESKKLLTHYWTCPIKETCHKCKFVVLSCSFMNVFMRSSRVQMMMNCNEVTNNNNQSNTVNSNPIGVNLTTGRHFSYKNNDK